jgi:hypothetical protein
MSDEEQQAKWEADKKWCGYQSAGVPFARFRSRYGGTTT